MRSFRHQRQSGFTLIELVIVIVIIGILAAVALPKYLALSDDAKQATVNAIAGNLAAAAATNFAIRSGLPTRGVPITACDAANAATLMNSLPTGITYGGSATACTLTLDGFTSQTAFNIYLIN